MRDFVGRALTAYQPEFRFVSAGFDAHGEDPLAGIDFTEDDYAWATGELLALARSASGARLVSVLEGGYNPSALARRVAAHVRALPQASALAGTAQEPTAERSERRRVGDERIHTG